MPTKVEEFKSKIRDKSDAVLIATPEYNLVPGVLKNASNWTSRPYGRNSFDDKPIPIMSAYIAMLGGARVHYHVRQMFEFLNIIQSTGERS
jgi:chromate reductase